jgi:tetratricopeptide (TPR) repeat protein
LKITLFLQKGKKIMKTFHFFCMLLVFFAGRVFSQTINESIVLYPSVTAIAQVNGSSYGSDVYNIGKRTVGTDVYISRSHFDFNLSQIPDNATISQVEVVYSTGGSGYSFKLTKLSSVSGNLQADWTAIGNASSLHTGVPYGSSSFYSTGIKTEIQNALGSNVLLIGGLSEGEGTNGSNSSLSFQLNVDYSYPAPEVYVTVRNDLYGGNGGNVGVAIYPASATSQYSPDSFIAHVQDRLNLAAYDNQTVNGKVWFFNDTEYQAEQSEWTIDRVGSGPEVISTSASFTTDQLTEADDGAIFNAYLKTTSYTTSGTMSSNETWFTSPVTITDNLTISSGVTLTIKPGVTVQVANGKKLTVNGTLLASASSGSEITFTSSSGTWYGIEVNNGGHFNPSFCNFANVQTAIRYYNADGDVHTCIFTDYSTALRYENSSSGRIDYSSMIDYGGTGIDAVQYSGPDARSYNAIEDNYYGVKADNTSEPVLGYYAGGGYNSLVNAVWDVYSTNYSTIFAVYNWWGSSSPSPNLYGDVDWEPYLNYNPLSKSNTAGNPNVVVPNFEPADTIGVSEFNHALRLYFAEDYATVLPLLQNLVSKYADYNIGRQALALENQTLKKMSRGNEALSRLLAVKQNHQGKEIAGLAQSIIVGLHVKHGEYEQAKNAATEVLGNFLNTVLEKYALYDLGMIHWYYLNDPKTGETYYRQLIAKYPDDDLAMSALATLGEWKPVPDKGNAPALTNTQNVPTEYALSQNFPNPFNPQTMIQYQLPEASHITVKIYNLFGQEVRTLVAGHREAGYHAEIWDGRDDFGRRVASGVYFYRLSTEPNVTQPNGFQFTRKMVLMQ